MELTKVDIIHSLADTRPGARYLEICTATTGNRYGEIDRSRFAVCERLMSRCPPGFDDGQDVDYSTTETSIKALTDRLTRSGLKFDIILVDPWHEYGESMEALCAALDLLDAGGIIVVHDCLPTSQQEASPHHHAGAWCGVTYKAYLDFLASNPGLYYCTVDIDYGCGIIRRSSNLRSLRSLILATRRRLEHETNLHAFALWKYARANEAAAFKTLQMNKQRLLNLFSFDEFRTGHICYARAPREQTS